ncbi:MAG: putative reverse transcriptase, partial [Streblomastix strix]
MSIYRDLSQSHQIPARKPPDSNLMTNRRNADPFSGYVEAYQGRNTDHQGYKEYRINKQLPSSLQSNMTIPNQNRSKQSQEALGLLTQKELQEEIVEEVSLNQPKWINPCFAIPKKDQGKQRKITDCSLLNKHLQSIHFIMEDIQSLQQLLQPKDFMVKIDLESAFHHIQVDSDFKPFLGFTFNHKYYQYKAKCFGVKRAPLIFHKTLRPVIKFIREFRHVRIIANCDDIIILHQNQQELIYNIQLIINILTNFGFKISMNKSVLQPATQIEFLRWQIDSNLDKLSMTLSRQKKINQMLGRRRRIVMYHQMVKVRFLAGFVGSLNFLRLQFKRARIHLKKLNKIKSWAALQGGWNALITPNMQVLKEIFWRKSMVTRNKPIQATIALAEAVLATDASLTHWGATLKLQDLAQEVWFWGKWSLNWHLTSSNQREAVAILCAFRRYVSYLKERQLKSLKIETDNSSAAYNINRGSAAEALAKLVDRTLETAEVPSLQLHALHIPVVTNRIIDQLSRLAISGDYSLHQEVFEEALRSLRTRPSIDMFANRKNRKLKRFVSLTLDSWAVGQDCMSLPWKGELPYLHPPLPMIQATLNKVMEENVAALIVVPNWPSQSWQQ